MQQHGANTNGNGNGHQQQASDDADRRNRFLQTPSSENLAQRERAASQPPHANGQSQQFFSSPVQGYTIPSSLNTQGAAWPPTARSAALPMGRPQGLPQSFPTRSSSFSASQNAFANAVRESRAFGSTFEDDESDALSEYDERILAPALHRGRSFTQDPGRSRSQSLAVPGEWDTSGLSVPARFGAADLKPPGSSRYGSLGPYTRQSAGGLDVPTAYGPGVDGSNMSPFRRDVGQILLDEGSAFRELWAGMNPPRDEHGGGGNGTASRRHSVSVVQPRRGNIVGFNAPGAGGDDDAGGAPSRPFAGSFGGGLMISDEELAGDLGMLSLEPPAHQHQQGHPHAHGGYARSPVSERGGFRAINLQIPASPSESARSAGGGSPQTEQLAARYIPGQGIQYTPMPAQHATRRYVPSPVSPSARFGGTAADVGRGVPLHAVPASWPLYIVEFKAGRTDLFYLMDLSVDVRVGDLVLVEADRGRDLGKVVNDSITLAEVEEFQRQQVARAGAAAGFGDGQPMSPGGAGGQGGGAGAGKKEINPKMIYGKAQPQDTQMLASKIQDEMKALQLCQSKVRQKKLPMEVVDAEYQWDRRKLTFYFVAEKRIDFRELVRELFRLYKTRIWMAALQGPSGVEQ